jgi:hypothetical protein
LPNAHPIMPMNILIRNLARGGENHRPMINGFEVARRNNIPLIVLMDKKARMIHAGKQCARAFRARPLQGA